MSEPSANTGRRLRLVLAERAAVPFVGVFDLLSASIAAAYSDSLFVSGFGFSASRYGLPDVGATSWGDLVDLVRRIRLHFPAHHLMVDIDDGFGDPVVAARLALELESVGASAVVLEDQARPRGYGQLPGRRLLTPDEYRLRFDAVREAFRGLLVARTDAAAGTRARERARAYALWGADAVLVKNLVDADDLRRVAADLAQVPLIVDQVPGGRLAGLSRADLTAAGVGAVLYSTASVEGAFRGIDEAVSRALGRGSRWPAPADVPAVILALLDGHLRPSSPR